MWLNHIGRTVHDAIVYGHVSSTYTNTIQTCSLSHTLKLFRFPSDFAYNQLSWKFGDVVNDISISKAFVSRLTVRAYCVIEKHDRSLFWEMRISRYTDIWSCACRESRALTYTRKCKWVLGGEKLTSTNIG